MDRKYDLETDEKCSENVRDEYKITGRVCRSNNNIRRHEKSKIRYFRTLFRKTKEQRFSSERERRLAVYPS